jgi:hypothetical protein
MNSTYLIRPGAAVGRSIDNLDREERRDNRNKIGTNREKKKEKKKSFFNTKNENEKVLWVFIILQ